MKRSMGIGAAILFFAGLESGFSQQTFIMPSIPTTWGQSWGIGARDMAMGGAFSAVGGDYAALHYNPAGLGTIKQGGFFGTFSMLSVSTKANFLGVENTEKTDPMNFNALGLTYPVPVSRGSLVFSFGYHRMRQFDSRLFGGKFISSADDSVTWEHTRTQKGFMSNTAFGLAVEAAPGVFLGGSLQFWGGEDNYNWLFQELDQPFNLYQFAQFDSSDHIRTRFSGANLTLGAVARSRFLQVGGALSTPFTLRCRENWDYSDIVTYDQDLNIETDISSAGGSPDYNIAMPMALRAGAALTAGPFLVSGDVEMLRYNQIEYKTEPSSASLTQASANSAIQRHLQNVTNVHVGGEFTSPNFPVALRGGYAVIRTPYRDVSYEKDRKVISAGIGLEMTDQLVLDAGFAYTEWEGPADDLIFKQNINAKQILVSLLYKMP